MVEALIHLRDHPLLAVAITLAAFLTGEIIQRRLKGTPLANPVVFSIISINGFLYVSGLDYETYLRGNGVLKFLLGPATVALAIPLYRNFQVIRRHWLAAILCSIAAAAICGFSALALTHWLGVERALALAYLPKSVSTPIALGIADQIQASQSLAIFFVFATGIFGALFGPQILRMLRLDRPNGSGLALGITCHALGVMRAIQVDDRAAAFAVLGMGLMGLAAAILLPLFAAFL